MEQKETVQFGDVIITAREMIVQEVDDLLSGRLRPKQDPVIDNIVDGPVGSEMLHVCTDATSETLRGLTPTELQRLADKVAELNPFFVRLLGKLEDAQTVASSALG